MLPRNLLRLEKHMRYGAEHLLTTDCRGGVVRAFPMLPQLSRFTYTEVPIPTASSHYWTHSHAFSLGIRNKVHCLLHKPQHKSAHIHKIQEEIKMELPVWTLHWRGPMGFSVDCRMECVKGAWEWDCPPVMYVSYNTIGVEWRWKEEDVRCDRTLRVYQDRCHVRWAKRPSSLTGGLLSAFHF